jgi:hypothetical protein
MRIALLTKEDSLMHEKGLYMGYTLQGHTGNIPQRAAKASFISSIRFHLSLILENITIPAFLQCHFRFELGTAGNDLGAGFNGVIVTHLTEAESGPECADSHEEQAGG